MFPACICLLAPGQAMVQALMSSCVTQDDLHGSFVILRPSASLRVSFAKILAFTFQPINANWDRDSSNLSGPVHGSHQVGCGRQRRTIGHQEAGHRRLAQILDGGAAQAVQLQEINMIIQASGTRAALVGHPLSEVVNWEQMRVPFRNCPAINRFAPRNAWCIDLTSTCHSTASIGV